MKSTSALTAFLLVAAASTCSAFAPAARPLSLQRQSASPALFLADKPTEEAVFVPPPEAADSSEENATEEKVDEEVFDKVEKMGKGAAKAKRGKRKSGKGGAPTGAKKSAASLAPEEVYYEGPPAITETIAPTISILTVIGIVPAAAAWARQAWVRYKITSRRIRVTSGVGGNDMSEIVYPDIVEVRTAKRLFGDGDMVAFLRDGAKFEIRNIPDFDEAMEFMLKYMDKEVVEQYRLQGDVTKPPE
ncbi:expressed unknown protein [Seminavis robusta]|uniref:YdbS-like PH domain-containing protein n=1 Tax=Seminavis robusta TaxID=568900 RepID=A0A9N8H960_9STRA|nr:expressed unknown protein [Seminavis robusta]|eukprot:Sro264_g102580.1 n/a (246) ;mRNA; f:51815-52648